jgi:predicted nicotinamide N-methyase
VARRHRRGRGHDRPPDAARGRARGAAGEVRAPAVAPEPAIGANGDRLAPLRASLAERLAELRGLAREELPDSLLDLALERVELPGGDVAVVRPRDWEQLRHDEGAAGRPIPYWATAWSSGLALARALAKRPPAPGARVLELGCGLAVPSVVAARAGASVLATDGETDAVAFAAHVLALNEVEGEVAHADWVEHGDELVERGPWELVLAADVLYTRRNVEVATGLLPRLVAPGREVLLADPGRAGGRELLAAARASFALRSEERAGRVGVHRLTRR